VSVSSGTGKLKMAGGVSGPIKESVNRAFAYMQSNAADLGIGRELGVSDFHIEVIDLLANRVDIEIGVGFFTAMMSALRSTRWPRPGGARRHERARKPQAGAVAWSNHSRWRRTTAPRGR
jgi:ATP-dependent Lon protease